jgi:transcriptional regulator with XRE-family HTH domain
MNEEIITRKELNFQKFAKMRPNLYILRCARGLSLKEIAKQIDIGGTRWEQLECRVGYPTIDELMKISEFFNVSIDDILYKDYKIIFV